MLYPKNNLYTINESLNAFSIDPIAETVSHTLDTHKQISFLPHEHVHVSSNYCFLQIVSHKFYIPMVFPPSERESGPVMPMKW